MMENHSFDNLLGMVPYEVKGRTRVDGFTRSGGTVVNFNPDAQRQPDLSRRPAARRASCSGEPEPVLERVARGVRQRRQQRLRARAVGGPIAMSYWDEHDLPFTYSLAQHFPLGQRYFCSVLAQTYPEPPLLVRRHGVWD